MTPAGAPREPRPAARVTIRPAQPPSRPRQQQSGAVGEQHGAAEPAGRGFTATFFRHGGRGGTGRRYARA
ncbi:hypothetical protein [Streptomyces sp. GbtcB6]|uniref:hypothetical protein n=1 Tax=Streptomyces sp. GbtcB6 TaxID=2824751 RepID=UPI001C2F44E4|nr:hypothetical protein [Streptomyces sp. GbtcB6]